MTNDNIFLESNNGGISDNTIKFYIENREYLKIDKNGFHKEGKLVEKDSEIYNTFCEFLQKSQNIDMKYKHITDFVNDELNSLINKKGHTQFENGKLEILKQLQKWT